jgi:hypothetical protein
LNRGKGTHGKGERGLEEGERGGSAVRQYGLLPKGEALRQGVSPSRVTPYLRSDLLPTPKGRRYANDAGASPVRVFSRRERRFAKGFPLIGASAYDWGIKRSFRILLRQYPMPNALKIKDIIKNQQ